MKKININQLEFKEVSTKSTYYSIIESLLFVSGDTLKIKDIAAIMECSVEFTKEVIKELAFSYEEECRGLKLIIINDECQLVTKPWNSQYIQKLLNVNVRQSLSQASLETLAIVAYKQPMTRIGIDEIRGVKSDSAVLNLLQKKLIKETGRLDVPGRPILYSTTEEFLKHFGLQSLSEMPSLEGYLELIQNQDRENEENKE